MAVIIKNMNMPEKCALCRFAIFSDNEWLCYATSEPQMHLAFVGEITEKEKPSWCPLKEIKE